MSRKIIDWEKVEQQYRIGLRSLKDIGTEFGVSDAAIIKRARRDGWDRDLKAKIQARAEAKVSAAMVSAEVSEKKKLTEAAIIEEGGTKVAAVQISQRGDIQRARSLCNSLLAELEAQTANVPELEHLGEILRNPGENGQDKLNDIYKAVISLPERTKTMKAWTESFRALIAMEREAYGIQATEQTKDLTVRLLPSDAGLL